MATEENMAIPDLPLYRLLRDKGDELGCLILFLNDPLVLLGDRRRLRSEGGSSLLMLRKWALMHSSNWLWLEETLTKR